MSEDINNVPENEEMEDIFIPRGNNYNALNEDIVVTEIVKESEDSKRKEGKIVYYSLDDEHVS